MAEAIRLPKWLLIVILVTMSGCAGLRNGAAPAFELRKGLLVGTSPALTHIRTRIESNCLDVVKPAGDTKVERNRLVTAYMFGVDLAYYQFERNLLNSVRENDMGAAAASLALSSIGSVVGDQNLARALSTTNSIVTGTHTAIGRDYLLNQTLTVLQTQMRANRANQRALIMRRRAYEYDQWDSCMALSDVLAYEQAGTLNGAIAAVSANAADAQREGEQRAQDAIQRVTQARDPLTVAMQAYLNPSDANTRRTRRATAITMMDEEVLLTTPPMVPAERLSMILNDAERSRERRVLAGRLVANDAAGTAAIGAAIPR